MFVEAKLIFVTALLKPRSKFIRCNRAAAYLLHLSGLASKMEGPEQQKKKEKKIAHVPSGLGQSLKPGLAEGSCTVLVGQGQRSAVGQKAWFPSAQGGRCESEDEGRRGMRKMGNTERRAVSGVRGNGAAGAS